MDGAAKVRLGRRLLAALDRQPSKCQGGCIQVSAVLGRIRPAEPDDTNPMRDRRVLRDGKWIVCDACRGTGQNLAGVLAPVEWSASAGRRLCDSAESRRPASVHVQDWTARLLATPAGAAAVNAFDGITRVVPRGEHRRVTSFCRPELMWTLGEDPKDWPTMDERITARGLSYAVPMDLRRRVGGRARHGTDSALDQFMAEVSDQLMPSVRELLVDLTDVMTDTEANP
jgi:hypothetical protein